MYSNNLFLDEDIIKIIAAIILLIVFVCGMESCIRSGVRSKHHMEYIMDCYCYDTDTKIIYIESETYYGNRVYSAYVNENGCFCRYNEENDVWEEIKRE